MKSENTTTTTGEAEYKWSHPLEWLRYKVNQHRDDPQWLADCITSLTTDMDGDTIQDLFQSEMDADGYFIKQTGHAPDCSGDCETMPDGQLACATPIGEI